MDAIDLSQRVVASLVSVATRAGLDEPSSGGAWSGGRHVKQQICLASRYAGVQSGTSLNGDRGLNPDDGDVSEGNDGRRRMQRESQTQMVK